MFNNIIYFIIVLLIFNIAYPDSSTENSLNYTLLIIYFIFGALFEKNNCLRGLNFKETYALRATSLVESEESR